MEPTKKNPLLEGFLENMAGRTTAIRNNRCIPEPLGCGKSITLDSFRNIISLREYRISGLCQDCQDSIFREEDNE